MGRVPLSAAGPDWLYSLVFPGLTQGLYGRNVSGYLFLLAELSGMVAWIVDWPHPWALPVHLAAAVHGAWLSRTDEPLWYQRHPIFRDPDVRRQWVQMTRARARQGRSMTDAD